MGIKMKKVFIDGSAGTTGLRIQERLSERSDIELIKLPEEYRKDVSARKDAINSADIVFLCLPDDAAREAVLLVENDSTVIIDTSTAHRTAYGWTYGFPEIGGRRKAIADSLRIANPGCHASGFIALVAPLVEAKIIGKDLRIPCFSLTGYSGGGKKMIADYEEIERDELLDAPRMYGLSQSHKHLPEMARVCGLTYEPVFCPIVADYYSGMEVTVQLFANDLAGGIDDIARVYAEYYGTDAGNGEDQDSLSGSVVFTSSAGGIIGNKGLVTFVGNADEGGFMSAMSMSGRDDMQVSVCGNKDRILLVSRFDNLGKGASGAAIQNMNIVMGIDERTGLIYS